jgi:hypothetical protein
VDGSLRPAKKLSNFRYAEAVCERAGEERSLLVRPWRPATECVHLASPLCGNSIGSKKSIRADMFRFR